MEFGKIVWHDLTVADAPRVRDFYSAVVGWGCEDVDMGGYSDYTLGGLAGVCHAQGGNAGLPPQWLIYVTVENLEHSIEQVNALGGEVIDGPKAMGQARFAVIKDPAGAFMALVQEDAG